MKDIYHSPLEAINAAIRSAVAYLDFEDLDPEMINIQEQWVVGEQGLCVMITVHFLHNGDVHKASVFFKEQSEKKV
ncbi:MAG: hypothetical protein ACO29O_01400 [Chitinophagaceae bacterium]